jgi:hypothetical protein
VLFRSRAGETLIGHRKPIEDIIVNGFAVTDQSFASTDPLLAPSSFALNGNFPNPFNPVTTIAYAVPVEVHTSIDVYDILGMHVRTLVDSTQLAGTHYVLWDGRRNDGRMAASGQYFCRMKAGSFTRTIMMTLAK